MKVAMIVLADDDSHEGLGRVVNAMVATKEMLDTGDDVRLVFDGGGRSGPVSSRRQTIRPTRCGNRSTRRCTVRAATAYCADAFEFTQGVEDAGVTLLDEYERPPSFRALLADGYQVITF